MTWARVLNFEGSGSRNTGSIDERVEVREVIRGVSKMLGEGMEEEEEEDEEEEGEDGDGKDMVVLTSCWKASSQALV